MVVITQATCVGVLPHGKEVYCVEKIGIIPLTPHSTITDIIGLEVRKLPIHVASFTKLKGKERTGPLPPFVTMFYLFFFLIVLL